MNTRFDLKLLCACLASSFVLLGCSGKAERISSHLQRGQNYYRSADPDKALLEVRNVLQMDPKNEAAYYLSGQVAESRGELQAAFLNYSKAVELQPKDWNAQAALGRLFLVGGETQKAQAKVDDILAQSPDNAEAQVVRAALLSRAGHVPEAIEAAKQIKFNGTPPENATLLLAALYAGQHREADGLAAIDAALVGEPKNIRLLSAAATLSARLKDNDKTAHYFTLATQAAPKNWELWREWANYYDKSQQTDQAEQVLRSSIKADPDDSKRYVALGDFLFERKGPDAGLKELVSDVTARPKDTAIQFALAQAYQQAGRPEDARKTLEGIVKADSTGPAGINARDVLASSAISRGDTTEARTLLDAVLKANPRDGTALTLRGQLELGSGQYAAAIADLRAAIKDRPDSVTVLGMLAQAHLANKEPELARVAILDSVKLYPANVDLQLLEANFLAKTGDYQGSLDAVANILKLSPKNRVAFQLKAAVLTARNDLPGAEKAYRDFVQAAPDDPTALVMLGRFYLGQKNFSAAITQFDMAAKLAPEAFDPRLEAVSALVEAKRPDEALKRVNAAIQAKPDEADNYQMLGEIKLVQKDFPAAVSAFNREIQLDPKAVKGYVDLARAQALGGDETIAVASLERGIATNPADTRLYATEADFLIHAGKVDEALAVYDRLLKLAPDDELAINNVAFLLTEFKSDPASLNRALVLTERFANSANPAYLDSLGWVHYKLGQYAQALPILQQAVNLKPDSPIIQLHLGMTLYKDGNVPEAKEHLRIATESNQRLPSLDEAKKILAQG